MRILGGLNYHQKLDQMIQECCREALEYPFESYVFIVDQPHIIEKLFFKYTHYLVNIEIMTWSQFLKQECIAQHLTHHRVMDRIEMTYHLRHIFHHTQLSCFTNQQIYPLIEKFIPLLKDFDLNSIHYTETDFPVEMKLIDFTKIYQALQQRCDEYTHLSLESLFNQSDFISHNKKHIYIEGDHLFQEKRQSIIKRLDSSHDVTIMYTHHNDNRLFNLPYYRLCNDSLLFTDSNYLLDNLFLQSPEKCSEDKDYYTFISPTPHQEVKTVIYNIYQRLVDESLHYSDFMIVYPDSTYLDLLRDQLSNLHIPHHLPIIKSCLYDYSYQYLFKLIDSIDAHTISDFAKILDKEDIDTPYHQYLQSLFHFDDEITNQEFKEFFARTCQLDQIEKLNNQDYISVCPIEQAISDHPQYIYILGMNETILPRSIKDTALLLDEDIQVLRKHHIQTPLSTLEQMGVHYNDILKVLSQDALRICFSYSLQTLSGETLIPSSLYKQIQYMFSLKEEPKAQFYAMDDFYQLGGESSDKPILNKNIHQYLNCKNQPEKLSKDITDSLYSSHLSVSQIETYNKCPFAYFIQYGLNIYPLRDNHLMPNELGSLVHYVLSICIDQDQDINQLVEDYIHQDDLLSVKIQSSSINLYFIEQLKKDLHITIQIARRQISLSHFRVLSKEEKITDEIKGINFKGFVDRIDQCEEKISIIDYKSSDKDIDLNLAMQGFNIQMLLYLKMVTRQYHKDPAAVLYFNTKKRVLSLKQSLKDDIDDNEFYKQYRYGGYVFDDDSHSSILALDPQMDKKSNIVNISYVKTKNEYKGHLLTPQQLDVLLKIIEDHIYELYTHIIDGDISISPKGSDQSATHTVVNPCRYCPYHSVCSFDVFYNDYQLVQFLDVDQMLGGDEDAI